jgi:hypothetical protein
MSDEDPGPESFEDKLRAFAKEFGESVERAAERLDVEGIAEQIEEGGERIRELAESAGQWLTDQFGEHAAGERDPAQHRLKRAGPHPLDLPTEEQALALSALESGRWKVKPGTSELAAADGGPAPEVRGGLVGELRARDWIAAGGEPTQLGRDALKRWSERRA